MSAEVPSQEEFAAFMPTSGGRVWNSLESGWQCPGCGRTKFELLRYLEGKGWFAQIVTHKGKGARRGLKAKICGDCANVQGDVKTAIPGLAGEWSFTPDEIRSIIFPTAHRKHKIDLERAKVLMTLLREMPIPEPSPPNAHVPPIQTPSQENFLSATSYSPSLEWFVGDKWVCPACKRSIFEITQYNKARPAKGREAHWAHSIARHHDHGAHETEIIDGRFPVTIICLDCNNVDGRVKLRLRGIPKKGWSFSPEEIASVISAEPHRRHMIDWDKAQKLVDEILAAIT